MKPIVFNDTIGWLTEAGGSRGVVIAGAHGFEDLCSRRFLKLLADRIAADGCPVLQFDYPGCGDASGDHTMPGRVSAWIESIGGATDQLKHETGVADVIVIGFRLGALLAARAIQAREDVAGLVLLAPPASGKAYVREMTALSRMIDAILPVREIGADPFDGRTVAGFHLSTETLGDLAALGWEDVTVGSMPMLVMASGQISAPPAWAAQLSEPNAETAYHSFEGYGRLMCDPTANKIPMPVIERCSEWVREKAGVARSAKANPVVASAVLAGPDYEEEPLMIGPKPHICGVFCRPSGSVKAKDAVIFLNSGAVPHVGWARGTVEAARMLAAEGVASLRIDLPGLGQSEAQAEERLFLYDARTRLDVGRAIDWLEHRGFARVSLSGICSGAFQAFHTARADKRVHRLIMINPLCFSWNSSYALDMSVWKAYETAKAVRGPSEEPARRSGRPRAVSAFKVITSKGSRQFIRRGLEIIKTTLTNAPSWALLQRGSVEHWMRDLANRGVRVLVVSSEGDLSLKEIERHFGPGERRLRAMPNIARRSLPGADHTLTPSHARHALFSHMLELGDDHEPYPGTSDRMNVEAARDVSFAST